ncbi:Dynein light intermediate chain [Aphelenchoides besseyi]|nr:Dynein light intermediate chain [Aphelenchoides besseyi]
MALTDINWTSPQKSTTTQQEDEKIWSQILEDVSSEATRVPQGSVIVLGENQCGKSLLITKMVGNDRTPNPSVLEYNYLTVHANEDNRQTYQLTSAATTTFGGQDSTNLPVWIMSGNESATDLLEFSMPKQLAKCILMFGTRWPNHKYKKFYNDDAISQARSDQLRAWQDYVEPAGSVYTDAVGSDFRPEFVELESGVLTETCGAAVIVVITKTDERPLLSADEMSRLQYQIRKFCLAHGAALFTKTAHIVDEKSVFIPSGWDSEKKLDLERESIENPDQPLTSNEEQTASAREKPIECEEEQTFLSLLAKALSESPASPKREAANAAPSNNKEGASPLATYFGSLITKKDAPLKGQQTTTHSTAPSTGSVDPASHFTKFKDTKQRNAPDGPDDGNEPIA